MCHNRYDEVWAIVDPLMPPKLCVVIDIKMTLDTLGGIIQSLYILRYGREDLYAIP